MKVVRALAMAAGVAALAACQQEPTAQENQAEMIEEQAENRAENIMDAAENRAENILNAAENEAEALRNDADDGGNAATENRT
jgi:vacuolar-type H+-ATPase subunit H